MEWQHILRTLTSFHPEILPLSLRGEGPFRKLSPTKMGGRAGGGEMVKAVHTVGCFISGCGVDVLPAEDALSNFIPNRLRSLSPIALRRTLLRH